MAEARSAAGRPAEHDAEDEGGGYEGEAMAVVEAIASNTRAVLILNIANRSALPFLDARAVVEVPCIVGRTGPVPVAVGDVPAHARALVERDQGRRAGDDRGRAHRLHRARRQGARAAPAGAVVAPRARSSTATAQRLPELQERFAMSVDVASPPRRSST